MGMNYHVVKNSCHCCGRRYVEHVGKASYKWAFSFQGADEIRNFEQWIKNVKSAEFIADENDVVISLEELLAVIEEHRDGKRHAEYYPNGNWLDENGNSFLGLDFC